MDDARAPSAVSAFAAAAPAGVNPHAVNVWLADLDRPLVPFEALAATLSAEEAAMIERFVYAQDRQRALASRGLLRILLSRLLGRAAARDLALGAGPFGKPELVDGRLVFNVSHAGGLGLFAVAPTGRLGVDIEAVRPVEALSIAEAHFSPQERRVLLALPPEAVELAFYRIWTRKEAFIKATGEGLHRALDSFSVSIEPDRAAVTPAGPWRLHVLAPGAGFVGALAIDRDLPIHTWRWA